MKSIALFLATIFFLCFSYNSRGQISCPDNIDFETGTTAVWNYFTGTCCPIVCATATAALSNRHRITSGTATDPYGGFPVVAPGGGSYSLKLGNSVTGSQAEKARYYVHVPTGVTNYSLIYRFAVVLEDPGHTAVAQPRFEVTATDSATGFAVPCSQYTYVAGGTLPGFVTSSVGSNPFYLPWATASINLSGLGGSTVIIDFASGDCGYGGHFGYGYLDMSCGLFGLNALACDTSGATFTAPAGYASYSWYDSSMYSTLLGTGQTLTLTATSAITIAVILTPYSGYGCPDTLYTHLTPSFLQMHMMKDTTVCFNSGLMLDAHATDIVGPLSYTWSPGTGLSCSTCTNPVCSPTTTTTYYVTVTNPVGCSLTDSVTVNGSFIPVAISSTNVPCFGDTTGTASVAITGSTYISLTYLWTTYPVQTTSTAFNLAAGTYSVTLTDTVGCTGVLVATITQPPAKILSISAHTHPTTCGGYDGTITLTGLFASSTDTITYVFNHITQTVVLTASATGTIVLSGLVQGTYDSFAIVTGLCPYNMTSSVILTDPPPPGDPYAGSNTPICLGDTLKISVIETTGGCAYSWVGQSGFTSAVQNPVINVVSFADTGWYYITVSIHNCFKTDSTFVMVKPKPLPISFNNSPICDGDSLYFNSSSSNGANTYYWSGPGAFSSTQQNPFIGKAGV